MGAGSNPAALGLLFTWTRGTAALNMLVLLADFYKCFTVQILNNALAETADLNLYSYNNYTYCETISLRSWLHVACTIIATLHTQFTESPRIGKIFALICKKLIIDLAINLALEHQQV